MPRILQLICLAMIAMITVSCQRSQDVVSEHWIQKRKHRSGFHLNLRKHPPLQPQQLVEKKSKFQQRRQIAEAPINPPGLIAMEKQPLEISLKAAHSEKGILLQSAIKRQQSLAVIAKERTQAIEQNNKALDENKQSILYSLIVAIGAATLVISALFIEFGLISAYIPILGAAAFPIGLIALALFMLERNKLKRGKSLLNEHWKKSIIGLVNVFKYGAAVVFCLFGTNLSVLLISFLFFPGFVTGSLLFGLTTAIILTAISLIGSAIALPFSHRITEVNKAMGLMVGLTSIVWSLISIASLIGFYAYIIYFAWV